MRLGILCVGRMKAGPERELFARYAKRIGAMRNLGLAGLDLREFDESPARESAARIAARATRCWARCRRRPWPRRSTSAESR